VDVEVSRMGGFTMIVIDLVAETLSESVTVKVS
jgi:hypothetical protein